MTDQSYKTVRVNGRRMRATRLRNKLGTRDLARDSGTNIMVINLMEKEGRIGAQMTLASARRIAEAAGLSLTDLFTDAPLAAPESPSDQKETDARAVIQLLSLDLRLHERDELAGALGWDIPRTDAAISKAGPLLSPVGLRITKANTRRGLRPVDGAAQTAYEQLMTSRASKGEREPSLRTAHAHRVARRRPSR
jgi:transcriptional regulator with XRE-family HTH domain